MAVRRGTVIAVHGDQVDVRVVGVGTVGSIPVTRHRAPTVAEPDAMTGMPRAGDRVLVSSTADSTDDLIVIGVLP